MAGVVIERLPFDQVIVRYDRPGTLFFLDPPYMGTEGYYGEGLFSPADHARLAAQLGGIKGRFILTINDCPEARRVFAGFRIASQALHYGVGGGAKTRKVRELIVQSCGKYPHSVAAAATNRDNNSLLCISLNLRRKWPFAPLSGVALGGVQRECDPYGRAFAQLAFNLDRAAMLGDQGIN